MYELKVKETEDKRQDSSLRRGHTSNIQRRQMPSSKNLRADQPNIFKAVQGKFKDGTVSVKNVTCCFVQRKMPEATAFTDKYNVTSCDILVSPNSTIVMTEPLQAVDKIDALQKISTEAAQIGNKVKGSEMADSEFFNAEITAKYKTNRKLKMINTQIKELDDNIYAEPYMKDGYREKWEEDKRKLEGELKPVTLSLKYQFRKNGVNLKQNEVGGPGYIVSVKKTRKSGESVTGNMINPSGIGVDTINSYSNRHESTQGSILEHTYKTSNTEDQRTNIRSKNFDAYTKLAGEGARFQCVRRNIATINDDTVIHAPGQNVGVKFSDLWKTWSASFDKEYDIPDSKIIEQLTPNNTLSISHDRFTTPAPVDNNNHIELEENDQTM